MANPINPAPITTALSFEDYVKASDPNRPILADPVSIKGSSSQYDTGFVLPRVNPEQSLQDYRAYAQPWQDKLGNGLVNMTSSAFTGALESTVGLVYGAGAALASGDASSFYNNEFGKTMDAVNEAARESYPFYYSKAEEEASLLSSMGTANFWYDKVLGGTGYTLGSMMVGMGAARVFNMGKSARLSQLTAEASAAEAAGNLTAEAAKYARWDMAKQAALGFTMAHGESSMEARQTYEETKQNYQKLRDMAQMDPTNPEYAQYANMTDEKIEQLSSDAADTNYLINLAVTGPTDMMLLGKWINPGKQAAVRTYNEIGKRTAVDGATQYFDKVVTQKGRALLNVGSKFMKGFTLEGSQEGLQFASNKAAQEFVELHSIQGQDWFTSLAVGMAEGLGETISSKEGLESILVGGISGGPFGLRGAAAERTAKDARTKVLVDKLNADPTFAQANPLVQKMLASTNSANSAEEHLKNGDLFNAKNAADQSLNTYIKGQIDAGTTDYFVERLQSIKEMDQTERDKFFGPGTTPEQVDQVIEKTRKLETLYNSIETLYGTPGGTPEQKERNAILREMLFFSASTIKDVEGRMDNIVKELNAMGNPEVGAIIAARQTAIGMQKSITPDKVPGGRIYQEYVDEMQEQATNNYNALLAQFQKDNPVEASQTTQLLADLNQLDSRKQGFIKYYNELNDPEKAQALLDKTQKTIEEAAAKAQELQTAAAQATAEGRTNLETVDTLLPLNKDRKNEVTSKGQVLDIARLSNVQLDEMERNLQNEEAEGKDVSPELKAAIAKEKAFRANTDQIRLEIKERITKASTPEEVDAIIANIQLDGSFNVNQEQVEKVKKNLRDAAEARAAQEALAESVKNNFKGVNEFFHVFSTSEEEKKAVAQATSDPELKNKVFFKATKNPNPGTISNIGSAENNTLNPRLKKQSPGLVVEVWTTMPDGSKAKLGVMPWFGQYVNNVGNPIDIQNLTFDEYVNLFLPGVAKEKASEFIASNPDRYNLEAFKDAHASMMSLYAGAEKLLEGTTERELTVGETKGLAGVNVSQGLYNFDDAPLSDFLNESTVNKPFVLNGTPVIISTSTFDGSVEFRAGKEILPTMTVASVLDADGNPVIIDANGVGGLRAELLPALNALSQRLTNAKVGETIYNKYWMIVEDPQGTVKIPGIEGSFDWRPVSAKSMTTQEVDDTLAKLRDTLEKRATIKDAQQKDNNTQLFFDIGNKLFIAAASFDAVKSFKNVDIGFTFDAKNKLTVKVDFNFKPGNTPRNAADTANVYQGKIYLTVPDNVKTSQDFINWFNQELQKEQTLVYPVDAEKKINEKAPFKLNNRLAPITQKNMRVNFARGSETQRRGIRAVNPTNVWDSFSVNVSRLNPRVDQRVVVQPVKTAAGAAMAQMARTSSAAPVTATPQTITLAPGLTSGQGEVAPTTPAAPAAIMTMERLNQVWDDIKNGKPVDPFYDEFKEGYGSKYLFPEDLKTWFEKKTNTKVAVTTTPGRITPNAAAATPVSTGAKVEYKREDFPEYQEKTDTPITQKLVDYLADTLGVPRIKVSDNKYSSWIKEQVFAAQGKKGAENLAQLEWALNGPRQVFDRITKFAELSGLGAAPATPTTTTTINAEKAKITSSEFTELKRLAKFFLENPKEPTVSGSVVTRYPALFKAVTYIEKRRQEELEGEKYFVKTNAEGLKAAKEFVDRVNVEYDAKLTALGAAPAPTSKGTVIGYLGIPNTDGSFSEKSFNTTPDETSSFYEVQDLGNGKYAVTFRNTPNAVGQAVSRPELVLYPISFIKNAPNQNVNKLSVTKPAIYKKENGKFVLVEKMDVYFGEAPAQERPSRRKSAGGDAFTGANSIGTYDEGEVIDRETAIENIKGLLPEFIGIGELLPTLEALRDGRITFGSFYNNMVRLASKLVKGREYHEAFHAVFRTMFTDKQLDALYKEAKALMIREFKKQGKSFVQAYAEWKQDRIDYENLPENIKKDLFIEEWMADEYPKWREGKSVVPKKSTTVLGRIFDAIKRFADWLTGTPTLGEVFQSLDEGKFSGAKNPVMNRFTSGKIDTMARSQIYVGNRMGTNGITYASYLDPSLEMVLVNTIASRVMEAQKANPELTKEYLIEMEMLELGDKFNVDNPTYDPIADNPSYNDVFEKVQDLDFLFNDNTEHAIEVTKMIDGKQTVVTEKRNFGKEARTMFKDKIKKQLDEYSVDDYSFDANEDNADGDGNTTERNFDQNFENKGGFTSLTQFLRKYIGQTTYNTTLDEFFGLEPGSVFGGEVITVAVNPKKVYNGLTKLTANQPSPDAVLRKIAYAARESSESGRFAAKFLEEAGVNIDQNGVITYDKNKTPLIQSVVKGFSNYSLNYLFTQFDRFHGEEGQPFSRVFMANTRGMDVQQLEAWGNQFNVLSKRNTRNEMVRRAENVRGLQQLELTSRINDGVVEQVVTALKTDLEGLGISLSRMYLKYLVLQNRVEKSEAQRQFIEEFEESIQLNAKDVHESLIRITQAIAKGGNPFERKQEKLSEEDLSAVTRLRKIAMDNAVFDENVSITTMVNADGKNIYPYQKANYHVQRIFELRSIDFTQTDENGNLLYPSEVHSEQPNQDYILNNYLLNNPDFLAMLKSAQIERIDGIKQTTLEKKGDDLKVVMDGKDREGATYGGMTERELMLQFYSLFADSSTDTKVNFTTADGVVQRQSVPARRMAFTIMEASNTLDVLNMPVQTVYQDGKLTDKFKQAVIDNIARELNRINKVRAGEYVDINGNPIDYVNFNSYNSTNKLRGLKFWENARLLDSIGIKSQLESGELSLEQALPIILDGMDRFFNNELTEHVETLKDSGILKEDGTNRLLPSKFTGIGIENDSMFSTVMKDNIGNAYFNMYLNATAIDQILMGDPALTLKDSTDWFKRAKGNNAAGDNMLHFDPANNAPVKTLVFGRETKEGTFDDFVNTDYVKEERIYKRGSKDYNDFVNSLPEEQRFEFLARDPEEIKVGDAQAYTSVAGMLRFQTNLGRMTTRGEEIYKSIMDGKKLTQKDWEYLKDNGLMLNSQKFVYYDGVTYVKMSIVPLTPEYTTTPAGTPIKGMEFLHNLRIQMEANNIEMAGQPSMMKKMIRNPLVIGEGQTDFVVSPENVIDLDLRYLRLQQENPSNKKTIKDPTQMLHLIAAEQNPSTPIDFPWDPSIKTVGQLVKKYDSLLAERIRTQYIPARNYLTQLQEGNRTLDTKRLVKAFRKMLETTGASQQLLDFLRTDDAGYPIENFNMPHIVTAFEQHFNNYFNKIFSQKVPGYKTTLQSGFGHKLIYDTKTGKIIPRNVYLENPSKYDNDPNIGTRDLGFDIPHIVEEETIINGVSFKVAKEVYKYSEVILPFHFAEQFGLKPGDEIPLEIADMFGTRIPSQDKHSSRVLRIVDVMPASYGSNMIFPHELILLTGSDFDVDSYYNQRFDHYVKKTKGFSPLVGSSEYKIVFGHPGIGKTFLKESGRTDVIDFDSDYKNRINEMFNLPKGFKARNDFQKANKEKYNQVVRELWAEAKQEALQTGKQLFASDMILLREFADDFDIVLTMSEKTFIQRAKQRNDYTPGPEGTEKWKSNLDFLIDKIDRSKVFVTDKYLSDLMISSEKVVKFMVYGNNEDSKWDQFMKWNMENNSMLRDVAKDIKLEYPDTPAQDIFAQALKTLGLPSTEEEFNKSGMRSVGEINNDLLRAKMVLHSNPSMDKINKTPATLDAIQNSNGTGVLDKLATRLGYASWKELEKTYNPTSMMGMVNAFITNKAGSKAIGAAVNNSQVYAVLTRFGLESVKENKSVPEVVIGGYKIGDISPNNFLTEDGVRIMDLLSTLTSSMTDNTKYGYNSKMNVDINTLSVLSLMAMNRIPLMNGAMVINSEYVRRLVNESRSYAIQNEKEASYQGEAYARLVNDLRDKVKQLDPTLLDEFDKQENMPVTAEDLALAMDFSPERKEFKTATAGQKPGLLLRIPVEYYFAQMRILSAYNTMSDKHVGEYIAFSQIMKLTKGISSSNKETSFRGDEEVKQYLDTLGLRLVPTRKGWRVEYKDKEQKAKQVYDFASVINSHLITLENLAVFGEKGQIQKTYFISQTNFSEAVKERILANINPKLGRKKKAKALAAMRENLLGYMMIKAWRKKNNVTENMNAYIFDDVAEKEGLKPLAAFKDEVIATNPHLQNNLVFTQVFFGNKDGISTAKYSTWSKGQKGFESLLLGDMRQLANSEARPLVHQMIKYMIAKEAMLFKNDSPISLINPSTLGVYNFSQLLTEMTPMLNQMNDAQFQEMFGMTKNELLAEFTDLFMRDANNKAYIPKVKSEVLENRDTEKAKTVHPVTKLANGGFKVNFDAGYKMVDEETGDEIRPTDEVKAKQEMRNKIIFGQFGFVQSSDSFKNRKGETKRAKAFEFPTYLQAGPVLYKLVGYVKVENRFNNTEKRYTKPALNETVFTGVEAVYEPVERFGGKFNGVTITPYGRTVQENEEKSFEKILKLKKAAEDVEDTDNEVVDETTATPLPQVNTTPMAVPQTGIKPVPLQEEPASQKQAEQGTQAVANLNMISATTRDADMSSRDNIINWFVGLKTKRDSNDATWKQDYAQFYLNLEESNPELAKMFKTPGSPTLIGMPKSGIPLENLIDTLRTMNPTQVAELDKYRC